MVEHPHGFLQSGEFWLLMLVGALLIGACFRLRYAIPIAVAAEVVLWWWGQDGATGVFDDSGIGDAMSMAFAGFYAALVIGMASRAAVCAYRRQRSAKAGAALTDRA
jgi:hypothetical protein